MLILLRAVVYASVFISLLLVLVPARLLQWSGVSLTDGFGARQIAGIAVVLLGAALTAWCVVTFAFLGRGTPAPFDPPRALVVRGPYRFVRNPMYLGAAMAIAGAGLYYASWPVLGYALLFLLGTHVFVRLYEEPTLTRLFGTDYVSYCETVRRWLPRRPRAAPL